ncbi:MOB kinase activator 3B [Crotalus adamanteus]|uniref:MOB kinase activator 3B n=1 Tax=Crotalus adamanteus TaxID=8729 RepID=A0AAW1C2W3_CROAD
MSIALKQVFNKDKTFRPKRKFEPGTQRFELHKRAQASLNSGVDLKAAVQLPTGEDLSDWVAVHVVDFFNRINLIYGTICEFCTERTCPVMSGGPKYEYRWQDDLKYKKPTALPAPQYMNLLMDWIEVQINNEDIFPTSGKRGEKGGGGKGEKERDLVLQKRREKKGRKKNLGSIGAGSVHFSGCPGWGGVGGEEGIGAVSARSQPKLGRGWAKEEGRGPMRRVRGEGGALCLTLRAAEGSGAESGRKGADGLLVPGGALSGSGLSPKWCGAVSEVVWGYVLVVSGGEGQAANPGGPSTGAGGFLTSELILPGGPSRRGKAEPGPVISQGAASSALGSPIPPPSRDGWDGAGGFLAPMWRPALERRSAAAGSVVCHLPP